MAVAVAAAAAAGGAGEKQLDMEAFFRQVCLDSASPILAALHGV
jgi:hypothetical protein